MHCGQKHLVWGNIKHTEYQPYFSLESEFQHPELFDIIGMDLYIGIVGIFLFDFFNGRECVF